MGLREMLDKFYYDIAISELRLMNSKKLDDKITYNSLLYLDLIAYTENCTVSYLAETLNIAKSAVTLKVKELEKLGVVEKTQSKQDKRTFYLSLTPKSAQIYEFYDSAFYGAISEIEHTYCSEDIEKFCEILGVASRHFLKKIDCASGNEEQDDNQ